jgi:hypothetical protein
MRRLEGAIRFGGSAGGASGARKQDLPHGGVKRNSVDAHVVGKLPALGIGLVERLLPVVPKAGLPRHRYGDILQAGLHRHVSDLDVRLRRSAPGCGENRECALHDAPPTALYYYIHT